MRFGFHTRLFFISSNLKFVLLPMKSSTQLLIASNNRKLLVLILKIVWNDAKNGAQTLNRQIAK